MTSIQNEKNYQPTIPFPRGRKLKEPLQVRRVQVVLIKGGVYDTDYSIPGEGGGTSARTPDPTDDEDSEDDESKRARRRSASSINSKLRDVKNAVTLAQQLAELKSNLTATKSIVTNSKDPVGIHSVKIANSITTALIAHTVPAVKMLSDVLTVVENTEPVYPVLRSILTSVASAAFDIAAVLHTTNLLCVKAQEVGWTNVDQVAITLSSPTVSSTVGLSGALAMSERDFDKSLSKFQSRGLSMIRPLPQNILSPPTVANPNALRCNRCGMNHTPFCKSCPKCRKGKALPLGHTGACIP